MLSSVDLSPHCIQVYIAGLYGTLLETPQNLIFSQPTERSVRSATITFLKHRALYFAATSRHVVEALQSARSAYQAKWVKDIGTPSPTPGAYLFVPTGSTQIHFNQVFTPIDAEDSGGAIDVALAQVAEDTIAALGRRAIEVREPPRTTDGYAVAAGYPEGARLLRDADSPKGPARLVIQIVHCTAPAQWTAANRIVMSQEVSETHGLNSLSGMSGGPIAWSSEGAYWLMGIVEEGRDLLPTAESGIDEPSILIRGQPVSPELLDAWTSQVPTPVYEQNVSKVLVGPQ